MAGRVLAPLKADRAAPDVTIDLIERFADTFGLTCASGLPDHQSTKKVTRAL